MTHMHSHTHETSSGGMGFLLGVLALIAFFYMLFAYGIPALQSGFSQPTIQVPGRVDVNVNK